MDWAKRLALIVVVLAVCGGCDQATKSMATSVLPRTAPWSILGDTIRLQVVYNPGAFMSLGATFPPAWRQTLFIAGAGFLLTGALAYACCTRPDPPSKVWAAALVCGGGAGNLLDRLFRDGMVVDFINLGIGPVRSGIFNVADVIILVGLLMFVYHLRRL